MSKWIEFATPVEETVLESNEAFLSRRGTAMAGMIGSLSARLEIINMNMRFDMEYEAHMTVDQWRRSVKQSRMEILETLISYQATWSSMQNYQAGEVGKEMSDRKIKEYTAELEALETLAL
jgi:N-glycosylase/DNA lyase